MSQLPDPHEPSDPALHTRKVRGMFTRIAKRYDLLNRLMTFGQDRRWRREAVRRLSIPPDNHPNKVYLDAGCGTGDLSFELLAQVPQAAIIACDLTPEMIAQGRRRKGAEQILWVVADAQQLPFPTGTFAGVVSGYLLRNVANLDQTLQEQHRVLALSGKISALDTTRPARNLLLPFIKFYYKTIIPLMGRLIAGDAQAYTYLPETSAGFLDAETMAQCMRAAGFLHVTYVRRMFGTQAIHSAEKSNQ